jgi:hypothetical protein
VTRAARRPIGAQPASRRAWQQAAAAAKHSNVKPSLGRRFAAFDFLHSKFIAEAELIAAGERKPTANATFGLALLSP